MNKLSRKLTIRISAMIIGIFAFSFMLNNYLLPKYYLHSMKVHLTNISSEIKAMELTDFMNSIEELEREYEVTIVYEDLNKGVEDFNEDIKVKFNKKRITLNKLFIIEENLNKVIDGKRVNQIYNQGKLKSSFLVSFIRKENLVVAVGVSITHDSDTVAIINRFTLYLILISIALVIILVWFFSKSIIHPLEKLKDISKDISDLKFKKVQIKTGDEIEELGESINIMSEKLEQAHNELEQKNDNLKKFISNITHELKTPLALLKAYSLGFKDGLDDGTYSDVIVKQVDDISDLVDNLLEFSKLEKETIHKRMFNIEDMIRDLLEQYKIYVKKEGIIVSTNRENLNNPYVFADEKKVEMALSNLLSNAIKYTTDSKIEISLKNMESRVLFSIVNGANIGDTKGIEKIWEPFYVIESSRNKKLSGTGLGLSIVRAILQRHDVEYGCNINENQIEIYAYFEEGVAS